MKTYSVSLASVPGSALLFGRNYTGDVEKLDRESHADYEERTWMNRTHADENGNAFIGPLAIKNCLRDAAKYLSESIPGKGKSTFTKHFRSGVMVFNPTILLNHQNKPIKVADIEPLWLNVPSDGQTGGTKRVPKAFPEVKEWKGAVEVVVLDDVITKDVLLRHLTQAGNFIGLGAMRVANGGICGRFQVTGLTEVK